MACWKDLKKVGRMASTMVYSKVNNLDMLKVHKMALQMAVQSELLLVVPRAF